MSQCVIHRTVVSPWRLLKPPTHTHLQADIGARAKFVLRKLASSIVPPVSTERHAFVQQRLGLTRTPAAENRWTKDDCVRGSGFGAGEGPSYRPLVE